MVTAVPNWSSALLASTTTKMKNQSDNAATPSGTTGADSHGFP
jgi:hypothetical protein